MAGVVWPLIAIKLHVGYDLISDAAVLIRGMEWFQQVVQHTSGLEAFPGNLFLYQSLHNVPVVELVSEPEAFPGNFDSQVLDQ